PHLYDGEDSVMHDLRRVVPRDDGAHQNPLNKVARCHQDVKSVPAVLHAGLKNLQSERG
ncbi:hypothetical protein XENOCAPTIV_009524, partial [Xenoophorus captivus]